MPESDPALDRVTAILWTLVAVMLVCLVAARVSQRVNDRDYSYVVPKKQPVHVVGR